MAKTHPYIRNVSFTPAAAPEWRVERWTQGGNAVGFRVVSGIGSSLRVAPEGGFVVDIYDPAQSWSRLEAAADRLCATMNAVAATCGHA